METKESENIKPRMLVSFLSLLTVIILVFICQLILNLQSEVQALREEILTTNGNVQNMITPTASPFRIVEEKCTACHTERRFTVVHGTSSDLKGIINRMERMPEIQLTAQDRDVIHASLSLFKCTQCHSANSLKKLSALNAEERRRQMMDMYYKSGSNMTIEEIDKLLKAYKLIQGF